MPDKEKENQETKPEIKNYTQDEVNQLIEKSESGLKDHIKKLNEENKNRRVSEKEMKAFFAKGLGLSETEKPESDQIKEAFSDLNSTVKDLQKELAEAKTEKAKLKTETKIKDIAEKYNFASSSDVLKLVDVDSEQLEDDIKALAETKPYLLKKKSDIPGANPIKSNNVPKDIDQQIADAIKTGNVSLSIALKNKKFNV